MKQLLILLAVVGLVFAQEPDKQIEDFKGKFQGMFGNIDELQAKLEQAKKKHQEIMDKFSIMSSDDKKSFFEKLREESQTQTNNKLAGLTDDQQNTIQARIAEIRKKFQEKKAKLLSDENKAKMNEQAKSIKEELLSDENKEKAKAQFEEAKTKMKEMKDQWLTEENKGKVKASLEDGIEKLKELQAELFSEENKAKLRARIEELKASLQGLQDNP